MKSYSSQFSFLDWRVLIKYLFFLLLSFIVIGSVALFFHLILGHEQEVIENWFHESSWYHLILVKILAVGMTLYLGRKIEKKEFESWFTWHNLPPYLISGLAAASAIMLFILAPQKREMYYYQYGEIFITYLANILLFLSDLFIVKLALKKQELKMIHLMCLGLFFYLMNSLLQGQILSFRCFYLYGFILSFYFLSRQAYDFKAALFAQVFCIVPLIVIFGQDAVWHDLLSPFKAQNELSFEHFIIVLFLSLYYFEWKIGRFNNQRRTHAE
jgi:hypothetical protein